MKSDPPHDPELADAIKIAREWLVSKPALSPRYRRAFEKVIEAADASQREREP